MTDSFNFRFDTAYRIAGLPFGVMPSTTQVAVTDDELAAKFGPWRVRTPISNVASCEESGGYRRLTTIGPAHLSFTDRGLTFATNSVRGLCIKFHRPVVGIDPTGHIRHPALTVTVADIEGLRAALTSRARSAGGPPPGTL